MTSVFWLFALLSSTVFVFCFFEVEKSLSYFPIEEDQGLGKNVSYL